MFDRDACLQVFGQSFSNLVGKPVLSHFRLKEAPEEEEQDEDAEKNSKGYFQGFSQSEFVCVKIAIQKVNTNW